MENGYLPLLCLSVLDADSAHGELGALSPAPPGHDGVHLVPRVLPESSAIPAELQHHQITNVLVQSDQEGVGLIP